MKVRHPDSPVLADSLLAYAMGVLGMFPVVGQG